MTTAVGSDFPLTSDIPRRFSGCASVPAHDLPHLAVMDNKSNQDTRPSRGISAFLNWYDRQGRDLPWRFTTDPYQVLVSEIMAQQTQISRVLPFFQPWLALFPDWKTLAEAESAEVIRAWSGLGYNRRALMLRNIARQVVENGAPASEAEWLELKGIGPYTAAALTVFSLGQRAVPVDTNIRRAAGRWFLGEPWPENQIDQLLREVLGKTISRMKRFADFFQALFDLGATICLKRPKCPSCPVMNHCSAAETVSGETWVPPARKPSGERVRPGKKHPDRIFRGRILKAVQQSARGLSISEIGQWIDPGFENGHDEDWVKNMVTRLETDGLVKVARGKVKLP